MSTESITETQAAASKRNLGAYARRIGVRLLVALLAIALIGATAWLAKDWFLKEDRGPQLTHTIGRNDLTVTALEQGILESSENTEIKCQVRGRNTVLWVVASGTEVKPGDVLVRLSSLFIEEQIDERTKYAHWSRSAAERSLANVSRAELAVSEYKKGRYVAELMRLEKELTVAESKYGGTKNVLAHAKLMADSEYISELEIEEKQFAVDQAKLDVAVRRTRIDVLKNFSRAEQLQTLHGDLASARAKHKANAERADADKSRRDRAVEEFKHCVINAKRAGLVIHPNAAKWESGPIDEGSTVHKDQVLLMMPDLSKMQVKVGMHESVVKRLKKGLTAKVTLPTMKLDGTVDSVASVTKPAGWWTGNEVKYDTTVKLPDVPGLRPGMSAEVEVIIAEYSDVLTVPVAAIVESNDDRYCWVKTATGTARRKLQLGDSDEVFSIVKKGLKEGDEVLLNPLALAEARQVAAQESGSFDRTKKPKSK